MGNRANIEMRYQGAGGKSIFFYTHWDGTDVDKIVKRALIRGKQRWDDESYLARIIFSEMVKDDILGETGYGISPYEIEAGSPKIVVFPQTEATKGLVITTAGISYPFAEYIALPDKEEPEEAN